MVCRLVTVGTENGSHSEHVCEIGADEERTFGTDWERARNGEGTISGLAWGGRLGDVSRVKDVERLELWKETGEVGE